MSDDKFEAWWNSPARPFPWEGGAPAVARAAWHARDDEADALRVALSWAKAVLDDIREIAEYAENDVVPLILLKVQHGAALLGQGAASEDWQRPNPECASGKATLARMPVIDDPAISEAMAELDKTDDELRAEEAET